MPQIDIATFFNQVTCLLLFVLSAYLFILKICIPFIDVFLICQQLTHQVFTNFVHYYRRQATYIANSFFQCNYVCCQLIQQYTRFIKALLLYPAYAYGKYQFFNNLDLRYRFFTQQKPTLTLEWKYYN
jgi:hypothetical protein